MNELQIARHACTAVAICVMHRHVGLPEFPRVWQSHRRIKGRICTGEHSLTQVVPSISESGTECRIMRPPHNKSRLRNKNSRRPSGNAINRVFESSGPDGKVRGNAQQIIEKYQALSRDAFLGGDRVAAENYAQHSEHYIRVLGEAQRELEQRRENEAQKQSEFNRQRPRPHPPANLLDGEGPADDGPVATPENRASSAESAAPQPDSNGSPPYPH